MQNKDQIEEKCVQGCNEKHCHDCHMMQDKHFSWCKVPSPHDVWEKEFKKKFSGYSYKRKQDIKSFLSKHIALAREEERVLMKEFIWKMDTVKDPICKAGYDTARTEMLSTLL